MLSSVDSLVWSAMLRVEAVGERIEGPTNPIHKVDYGSEARVGDM